VTEDWIKMARHYAARDLAFIVGGASLLLCLDFCWPGIRYYAFGSNISGPEYLLLAAVAYVLGYLTQEVLSVLLCNQITTSCRPINPSKRLNWAYKRCTHAEVDWTKLPDYDEDEATIYINKKASERDQADYERMTAHLVMCMTIGSCWAVGALFLMGRIFFVPNWRVLVFGLVVLSLGCCLVFLGRLKALRIRKLTCDLVKGEENVERSLQKSQRIESQQ